MVANGLIDTTAVVGLTALGLAGALVAVAWRLSRSNERLAGALSDLSLAKPWTIFQRQKDGSTRPAGEVITGTITEREALASAKLAKAQTTRGILQGGGLGQTPADEVIEDERMAV